MEKRIKATLPNPLEFRLNDPNYTIYHRAALGGLAATISEWRRNPPQGITADVQSDYISLRWGDDVTNEEAFRRILEASFRLNDIGLIDLPGQRIDADRDDLRLVTHEGILNSFLQSKDARKVEGESRTIPLRSPDDESDVSRQFKYRGITKYFHQNADRQFKLTQQEDGSVTAAIEQWIIPGAFKGAVSLNASLKEAFLLLYLLTGSCVFTLRPRRYNKRKQDIQRRKFRYCLVVPDVADLKRYSTAIRFISAKLPKANQAISTSQVTYLDRVVGGAEEAALRFLIDLEAQEQVINVRPCVAGCLAITMGKVAWDLQQTNRSAMIKIKQDYPEIEVFKAAKRFRNSKFIQAKKGESMAEVVSPIPEMVAANLAAERHWCSNFKTLIGSEREFRQMLFDMKGGLNEMHKAIKDEEDKAVIAVFQEAWNRTMGQLGGAATRRGSSFERSSETRAERIRNEIMRARTSDQLAKWFLGFCASATKGKPIDAFGDEATRKLVCKFIFDPRNFERFQNLCLFALVSYASDKPKTPKQGKE